MVSLPFLFFSYVNDLTHSVCSLLQSHNLHLHYFGRVRGDVPCDEK